MKIGFANKRQNPDEQWHGNILFLIELKTKFLELEVNVRSHKRAVGYREDRQKRAGGDRPYNRRGSLQSIF